MARRQSPRKSESHLRGWETRRRNERAEARAHARRAEAGRRGWERRERRERREAAKARREFLESLRREMGLPVPVAAPRRRKERGARPEIIAPERGPVEVRGILVFENREGLRQFSPKAESRKIASTLDEVVDYINEIAGKAYFVILVVPDAETGRVFYQPFFIPERAPDWNPRKRRRSRKYRGGAEKKRLKAAADRIGIGV